MKIKIVYICLLIIVLAILGAGLCFLSGNKPQKTQTDGAGVKNSASATNSIEFEPAMAMRGPGIGSYNIFSKETALNGRVFLFTEPSGAIDGVLYKQNETLESPQWKIIQGQSRDWLDVSTVSAHGTGLLSHKDTWYVLDSTGVRPVLSYISDGMVYNPDLTKSEFYDSKPKDYITTTYFKTELIITNNDQEVKILTHYLSCPYNKTGSDETNPNCKEQTYTEYYSWNDKTNMFECNAPDTTDIRAKIKTDFGWDWVNGF